MDVLCPASPGSRDGVGRERGGSGLVHLGGHDLVVDRGTFALIGPVVVPFVRAPFPVGVVAEDPIDLVGGGVVLVAGFLDLLLDVMQPFFHVRGVVRHFVSHLTFTMGRPCLTSRSNLNLPRRATSQPPSPGWSRPSTPGSASPRCWAPPARGRRSPSPTPSSG